MWAPQTRFKRAADVAQYDVTTPAAACVSICVDGWMRVQLLLFLLLFLVVLSACLLFAARKCKQTNNHWIDGSAAPSHLFPTHHIQSMPCTEYVFVA